MASHVSRLWKADEMIESLAFLEVRERLVRSLLDHVEDANSAGHSGYLRAGKLTHKELAARIGSPREAVSKCLNAHTTKMIVKEADGNIPIARNALDRFKKKERI